MTILRSGGDYDISHVDRMRNLFRKYAPELKFECISDTGKTEHDLLHAWEGWWAKIEVFRFVGPIIYIDLDMTLVDDFMPFVEVASKHDFVALRRYRPEFKNRISSALMYWGGDYRYIYEEFLKTPDWHIKNNNNRNYIGDQGFIDKQVPDRAYWQDLLPNKIVSYRRDCQSGVPSGVSLVGFHGKPRPWEVTWRFQCQVGVDKSLRTTASQ